MPLTVRPTGLGSGIDKDRPDYTVYCDAAASMKLAEALRELAAGLSK